MNGVNQTVDQKPEKTFPMNEFAALLTNPHYMNLI